MKSENESNNQQKGDEMESVGLVNNKKKGTNGNI